jgi:hypothetical protein
MYRQAACRAVYLLAEEARWLAGCFQHTPSPELFPLLNVGSSTAEFRTVTQPFIQREIFNPLARRGGDVVHVDAKASPGVDVTGDMTDPGFVAHLKSEIPVQSVLVSNLLEHVTDRSLLARVVLDLVPAGGLIFVSGPHRYPYHPDPIDTGFRPSLTEVHALFPGTSILDSAIIPSPTWRPWGRSAQPGVARARYFARLCLPVYRPADWRLAVRGAAYLLRPPSAYGIVLAKGSQTVG